MPKVSLLASPLAALPAPPKSLPQRRPNWEANAAVTHGWVYPKVAELHVSEKKSHVRLAIQLSQRGLWVTILFTLPQSGASAATELVPVLDIKTSCACS